MARVMQLEYTAWGIITSDDVALRVVSIRRTSSQCRLVLFQTGWGRVLSTDDVLVDLAAIACFRTLAGLFHTSLTASDALRDLATGRS